MRILVAIPVVLGALAGRALAHPEQPPDPFPCCGDLLHEQQEVPHPQPPPCCDQVMRKPPPPDIPSPPPPPPEPIRTIKQRWVFEAQLGGGLGRYAASSETFAAMAFGYHRRRSEKWTDPSSGGVLTGRAHGD